jgi:hypothetical protein
VATLEQLERALVNADKAGDMDAARRLAPIIKAERARRDENDTVTDPATGRSVKLAPIPGMYDNAQIAGTTPGPPPTSIGDKIVGTGEAALSIGTSIPAGIVAPLVGMAKGIKDQIVTGGHALDGGRDEAAEMADSVARAMTYAPRGQAGQQIVGKVGELAEPLVALGPMGAELGVVSEAASATRPVVRAAVSEAAAPIRTAAAKVVDPIKQAAGTLAEQVKQKIAPGAESAPTAGTGMSAGSAAVDVAAVRDANARELGFTGDKALTEGQKTRAFEQQRFERETAKQGDVGEPIRQRMQNQNLHLQQKLDEFIDSTGAELTETRDIGGITDKALRQRAAKDKTKVRTLFKEFENSEEFSHPIDAKPVRDMLVSMQDDADLAPVVNKALAKLDKLAANNYHGQGNNITLKLGEMVGLRKTVTAAAKTDITNKNNLRVAGEIKKAIDSATEGKGGELYKKANAAHAQMMSDYENFGLAKQLLGLKKGSSDRALALEDVLHKSVVSPSASVDSVMKLKSLLQTEGETGQQAWKELQGGTLRHIRDEALKGVTRDTAGNQIVNAGALDKVVTSLDKTGKLEAILGKQQADKVRLINDVAKDVFTSPPGAVNTSNTATVLAGLMDVAISGTTGVPAPVATVFNQVVSRIKDAKLRARVKQSLGE